MKFRIKTKAIENGGVIYCPEYSDAPFFWEALSDHWRGVGLKWGYDTRAEALQAIDLFTEEINKHPAVMTNIFNKEKVLKTEYV